MGMSIEERIAQLVRVKHYAAPRHYETLDLAIETMRKYQKIIGIIEYGDAQDLEDEYVLDEIREVLKDGNG